MSAARRRMRAVLRGDCGGDAGFTVLELLVAMSIFVVVISISVAGITTMAKDTKEAQSASDGASAARKAFLLLDRQVRYASDLESVVSSGGYYYFRFQSNQDSTGNRILSPTCTEWRQHASGDAELEMRTWTAYGSKSYPSGLWQTMATGVTNPATSVFTVFPPSSKSAFARVEVRLSVTKGGGATARNSDIRTTLTARNSEVHEVRDIRGYDESNNATPPTPCPWN